MCCIFAGSRTRVDIPFTPELEERTLDLIRKAKAASVASVSPPPLEDSPKCSGCSLAGICLPDETHVLQAAAYGKVESPGSEIRQFFPPRDDALRLCPEQVQWFQDGKALVIWSRRETLPHGPAGGHGNQPLCGNISVTARSDAYVVRERDATLPVDEAGFMASPAIDPRTHICGQPVQHGRMRPRFREPPAVVSAGSRPADVPAKCRCPNDI